MSNDNSNCFFLVLEGPEEIPKSKMQTLEIFLENGPGCQTKKVWVEVTAKHHLREKIGQISRGTKHCRFGFEDDSLKRDGNRVYVGPNKLSVCYNSYRTK